MSLPNHLSNIKASGIYRFVFDKSEIPTQDAETLRLVVGYSEKGAFNTPVYIESEEKFRAIYGGINKKLERYGIWFHRMALQALRRGPILALNLKPFTTKEEAKESGNPNAYEHVECLSFNPQSTWNEAINLAVKDIYNTNRFWTLEPEQLEDLDETTNQYISITSTDSVETSNTIFVRGYRPSGYDITIKEWFSAVLNGEDVPSYLEGHENDLVSQYFAEIYVFKGEFTPTIAASDKLAKYFDIDGETVTLKPYILNAFNEKLDTLEQLSTSDASNFVNRYQGIILPEFLSSTGSVISLDYLFNTDNPKHKMMMRLNQALLYNGDIDISELDTTGWTKGVEESAGVMSMTKLVPQVSTATYGDSEWQYEDVDAKDVNFYAYPVKGFDGLTVTFEPNIDQAGIIEGDKFLTEVEGETTIATLVKMDSVQQSMGDFFEENKGDYDWKSKIVLGDGTVDVYNTLVGIAGTGSLSDAASDVARILGLLYKSDIYGHATLTFDGTTYYWDVNGTLKGSNYVDENGTSLVSVVVNKFKQDITDPSQINGYKISVKFGDGCTSTTTFYVVEEISDDDKGITDNTTSMVTLEYIYTFDKNMENITTESVIYKCNYPTTATSAYMVPTYVKGYTYMNGKPVSTKQWDKLQWQHTILDVLTKNKGIRIALTSRNELQYRYLVDTFEGFVEKECKAKLARICKERDNVFGLLNFPAMYNFIKCDYTLFKDDNGNFDTRFIAEGGNRRKAMAVRFTLASEENGASFVSYNTCLNFTDLDTNIKYTSPAAAVTSNLFMDKYDKYFPYTIVAGSNRARCTEPGLIGPDFTYSNEDLSNLEPMGVNCWVMVPGEGTYINSNQTAKQNPVTNLSRINVRELCIFLQDEIEKLLRKYHWDFNTPNLRNTIKDRADVILETARNNGGVWKYVNVCDESNNTDEIIDNEFFVLSTSIEPGIGAGKMVQELTIYRRGGMSSIITQ